MGLRSRLVSDLGQTPVRRCCRNKMRSLLTLVSRCLTEVRHHALALLLLLAVLGGPAPTHAHPPTIVDGAAEKATAEEVVDFRKRLADAVKAKDAAKLREMYATTFQHTHTSGNTDGRDARIVALLAGDPVIETAAADDLVVRVHAGGWVAIASGTSPIVSLADGKTYAVKWTVVYVRAEQSWQIVASQATRNGEIKK